MSADQMHVDAHRVFEAAGSGVCAKSARFAARGD
jgi:hypothetical protein